MAGSASNVLRSGFVLETTIGTTPTSPAFKTLHEPAVFTDMTVRGHQSSNTAGGALMGDTFLEAECRGSIKDAPLTYTMYDTMFESLFQSQFSADVMTDGKTPQAFSFENALPAGQGGALVYKRYKGVEVVGGNIAVDAAGKVRLGFDLLGRQTLDAAVGALSGATYIDPTNYNPFGANAEVGTITIAGFTLDDMVSMSLDLTMVGRDPQKKLGGLMTAGTTLGAFQPTGKMRFLWDANVQAMYNAARAAAPQSPVKITINLGSEANKKYKLEFWECTIETSTPDFSGNTAYLDVMFQALYSRSVGYVCKMTRNIA